MGKVTGDYRSQKFDPGEAKYGLKERSQRPWGRCVWGNVVAVFQRRAVAGWVVGSDGRWIEMRHRIRNFDGVR